VRERKNVGVLKPQWCITRTYEWTKFIGCRVYSVCKSSTRIVSLTSGLSKTHQDSGTTSRRRVRRRAVKIRRRRRRRRS